MVLAAAVRPDMQANITGNEDGSRTKNSSAANCGSLDLESGVATSSPTVTIPQSTLDKLVILLERLVQNTSSSTADEHAPTDSIPSHNKWLSPDEARNEPIIRGKDGLRAADPRHENDMRELELHMMMYEGCHQPARKSQMQRGKS